jgi:hypothetical protein
MILALLYTSPRDDLHLGLAVYAIVAAVALFWLLHEWRHHKSRK